MAGETVTISGEDHRYLTRVLRLAPGDRVMLFDGRGAEADAELARIGPRDAELRLIARRAAASSKRGPALILLQALARGEKMDFVMQKATELGADRIIPVATARAVPHLEAQRSESRHARWEKIAREAARQCGRADVPAIDPVADFVQAVSDLPEGALKLLFYEAARAQSLKAALNAALKAALEAALEAALPAALPSSAPAAVAIAIGPEGGFTDEEAAAAEAAGFVAVGLGPRILRTETAALAALAILDFVFGDPG